MKKIIVFLIMLVHVYAGELIQPNYTYQISTGLVTDLLVYDKNLYVSTDNGHVFIYDMKTKQKIKSIHLPMVEDFMGDRVESKIFSLDMLENQLLILSEDSNGYSRIHLLHSDGTLEQVVSKTDALNIVKAKFIDKNRLLFALISNDLISYTIQNQKKNWVTQASMSKFSSFALNKPRTLVAVADESGDVHVISTKDGTIVQTLSGENVDNIFSVAFRNNLVITGGQDRRVGVYNLKNGKSYHKSSSFFVYGVGLSPSGKIGAYSSDLQNNVTLFYTDSKEDIATYQSNQSIVNGVYFINENEFFINSNGGSLSYYKVK